MSMVRIGSGSEAMLAEQVIAKAADRNAVRMRPRLRHRTKKRHFTQCGAFWRPVAA
jgi:hypothetical protein